MNNEHQPRLQAREQRERQLTVHLQEHIVVQDDRIAAARAQINRTAASPFFKIAYLLTRLTEQGFSKDAAQRKAFWNWLLRKQETPGIAYTHPLMSAVDMLDGKQSSPAAQAAAPAAAEWASSAGEKPDIIVLSVISYTFRHQRPQHFARRLAAMGHRVFYVNADFGPAYSQNQLEENLWQVTLKAEGFTAIHETDRLELLQPELDTMLQGNSIENAVVLVDYPNWIHAALYLRRQYGFPMITDYMDDFTGFLNPAEALVKENCQLMLRETDCVAASSQFLFDIATQYTNHVTMIRNGTEFDYFHQIFDANSLPAARPEIGYYGAISEWFHADIVCRAAERFPHCDIVLVGTVVSFREQLQQYPNIRLVGEVPYAELLPWLQCFDVCLIPFDTSTDLIKATNPVKFYEYLSAGKKVVATEIPELEPFRDKFVYLENDPDKFCDAIARCLQGSDTLASPAECAAFAREHDWDARTELLVQQINTVSSPD